MARQVIVLALVLVAIVGLASAAEAPAHAPTTSSHAPTTSSPEGGAVSEAPAGSDDVIGNTDEASAPTGSDDDVVAAPVGSEEDMSPAEAPKSGASAIQVSALAGVAATAVAGFFF